jgi:hypothetical protein
MAEQRHTLLRLANQVHTAYALLPCKEEVTSDATLKILCDAAEKSASALYSYLNDRIANTPRKDDETDTVNHRPRFDVYCGACDPDVTYATIHNCGMTFGDSNDFDEPESHS